MPAKPVKTLDEIIEKADRFDLNKVCLYTATSDDGLVIMDSNLFQLYKRYIDRFVQTFEVTDSQREYYRGKPDLLSQDTYGTPELAWLIIQLNDQESYSKFRIKKTIKLISPTNLANIYDTVITRSSDRIAENHNKYLAMVADDLGD